MKPKEDTMKDGEKDSGIAGNKRGIDYHYHVAMCLCLEGHRHKQGNPEYEYRLHQEDKNAGMFDDLVYEYRNNQSEPWTRLLIQIKNKKSNNTIKTSNLLYNDKKETFSLLKFFKSSKEIKDTENCLFIIYTNASFEFEKNGHLRKWYKKETKEEICLLPSKEFYIPILDMGSQYKFHEEINVDIFYKHTNIPKEEWKQFINKLVFAVNQPDLEEIKSIVINKIEKMLPKSTEKIRCGLVDKLDDSLFNKKQISSKDISDLIANIQKEIELYHTNKYEDGVLDFDFHIPLHQFFISSKTILAIKSNNSEICLHKLCKEIKRLREDKPNVNNKYTMKNVYSIKQVTDIETAIVFNLLIICIKTSDQLITFHYIPKKDEKKYIIVVPNEMKLPEIQNCYQICEDNESTFRVLTDSSKQLILNEKCVLLNQQKSSFSDILKLNSSILTENQVDELSDVITEDVIQCFLSNDYRDLKIEFNRPGINNLGICKYIERHLYYSVVIDENKINEFKELFTVDNLDKFKKQCNENLYRTCHHFKKYKTFLVWDQSNGDLTYLREFINKNRNADTSSLHTLWEDESITFAIKEDNLCSLHNNTNIIIIADKAGMGKTMLMSNLYYNLQKNYPSRIIIRLNLNDHTDVFNKKATFGSLEFLKNILFETKSSILSQNLLNIVLKKRHHIFLILDGVDELCPEYKKTVFIFIKTLNDLKIARLFVTTRPAQAIHLEEITSQFALSIKPFTKEDQLSYLNEILINKKTDTNKLLKKINENSNIKDLLGVPLLLKIVTDIINNSNVAEYNIEDIFNLSQLFKKFIDQKFHIYSVEKKRQVATNAFVKGEEITLQKMYIKKHEILAMKLIFVEEIIQEKYDEDLNEQIVKIGIITKITDQKAEFIHRTFAEYFVSTYIQKHFNEERVMKLIFTNVLTENDLTELRKFINSYIQNEFKNDEIKNKYKQLAMKIHTNANEDYTLLSKLLTAAHENNKDILNFILECFAKDTKYLEKMLSYESNITKIIPLQAAIRQGNIQIAKQLITYCFENNINEESKAFKYMLGVGDKYGNTALYDAANGGHTEIVKKMIDRGADVNISGNVGLTALNIAAYRGYTDIVNVLLDRGADVNIGDNDGLTPLYFATQKGSTDIVNALLNRGADVNIANYKGYTALSNAVANGNICMVNALLDRGADVNKGDNNGLTALHIAAENGHTDIVNALLNRVVDVNKADKAGDTALYIAAQKGYAEIVITLLDGGADVNITNNNGYRILLQITGYNGNTDSVADVNKGGKDGDTALYIAAYNGHTDVVNKLLDRGADVNIANYLGFTALHRAVDKGHTDIVNKLLDRGANVNIANYVGFTALHRAVDKGHTYLVNKLLDRGANVNIANYVGFTALHRAVDKGHTDIMNKLLDRGANVNITDNFGSTALYRAAYNGHTDIVNSLLDRGANVNKPDYFGSTALYIAVQEGHTNSVKTLLDRGANVNKSNKFGVTALDIAAQKGQTDIVNTLLDKGADVNLGDNNGTTALHNAAENGHTNIVNTMLDRGADVNRGDDYGFTALYRAAYNDHTDIVNTLLDRGANVNIANNGVTALHIAALFGHTDIVNTLLERGAAVNKGDNNGTTALYIAAQKGHTDTVSTLLDRGADVNKGDREGDTPLHLVASRGHTNTLYVLLDRGAEINKASINGFTPLHWAAMYSCAVSIRVLLERGADVNIRNVYGERALQLAHRTGNYKLVQLLLRYGNDLCDHSNSDSDSDSVLPTGLFRAVWRRNMFDVESYLIKCDINAGDSHNRTPLYWAALFGECDIMKVLLSEGADVNITDINGSSVLQAAFRSGNYRAVQLLFRYISDHYNYYDSDSE